MTFMLSQIYSFLAKAAMLVKLVVDAAPSAVENPDGGGVRRMNVKS
jgi:hypothetical protein